MATATFDKALVGQRDVITSKPKAGYFASVFAGFVAAREAEARRKVATHLADLSDNHLVGIGMSAAEIKELRTGAPVNVRISG